MNLTSLLVLGLAAIQTAAAPAPIDAGDAHTAQTLIKLEPADRVAQRLQWWSDARFGMFIHWGLYSQWGCHFPGPDGKLIDGGGEHMMQHLEIPLAKYATIADVFNPVKFSADEWAKIAKDAGMKYLVLTSKHHDGFAMFDSPSNDYNIVKRTPFGRDPVKELAEACRKEGLHFCVYYSLGRDWQDPDVPTKGGYRSNTWDYPDESKKVFARYFERKLKPQVRELLTQYGPIGIMWFDTPEEITAAESRELLQMIRSIQPDCIVNQRVGNRLGDYRVAEQQIPEKGFSDPWETCMTVNGHWGYEAGDERYKSPTVLIQHLVDIASKGGNFLLNVGPTGEGVIPQPSVDRLHAMGEWLRVNGEAIYGTTGSPLPPLAWGRATQKVTPAGTTVYLHVFEWPQDGQLTVPGLMGRVASVRLLAGDKPLASSTKGRDLVITVPKTAPDSAVSTIAVCFLKI